MSSESQNRELKIRKIKTKLKYIKYAANTNAENTIVAIYPKTHSGSQTRLDIYLE
jgi:hypothetical protein